MSLPVIPVLRTPAKITPSTTYNYLIMSVIATDKQALAYTDDFFISLALRYHEVDRIGIRDGCRSPLVHKFEKIEIQVFESKQPLDLSRYGDPVGQ